MTNIVGNKRRVGLLGAGYISKFHASALRAVDNVELAAVCDVRPAGAEALALAHNIPEIYGSLEQMLEQGRLSAVHVLLPPQLHGPAIARILDAGVDVFTEKPLTADVVESKSLLEKSISLSRNLGVSHNFLFSPIYERFFQDYSTGHFGRVDHIDIVWNKHLGQLAGGNHGGWLFARPENVLFEVGPHSFGHLAHLLGGIDDVTVLPFDRVDLSNGNSFYRRWEILGHKGSTSIRLRFSFIDGFSEHYIQLRGTAAAAVVDFEKNSYLRTEHSAQMLDIDRYVGDMRRATSTAAQASKTLGQYMLSKMRLNKDGAPYQQSITRCVRRFYEGLEQGGLDIRLGAKLGIEAVAIAESVTKAALAKTEDARSAPPEQPAPPPVPVCSGSAAPTVLVLGGTGFIGKALVRRLRQARYGVRLLTRNENDVPGDLRQLGVSVMRGDLSDAGSIENALVGIKQVYHLARGHGDTWDDYVKTDIEPTRRLAELCIAKGVERLYYTSTIAIYYAGKSAGTITEDTAPHDAVLKRNIYPRAKVEMERMLLDLHRTKGLGAVIFRPGIVLGTGGNPLHWGIAAWPFSSVPRLYGKGNANLPVVLVDDCADAMVRAQEVAGIEGESFNIVGEPVITAQGYLDEVEKAAGIRFNRVPTSALRYFFEDLAKYAIKAIGRDASAAPPSYANADSRSCEAPFDARKARDRLAWTPTRERARVVEEGIIVPVREFLS